MLTVLPAGSGCCCCCYCYCYCCCTRRARVVRNRGVDGGDRVLVATFFLRCDCSARVSCAKNFRTAVFASSRRYWSSSSFLKNCVVDSRYGHEVAAAIVVTSSAFGYRVRCVKSAFRCDLFEYGSDRAKVRKYRPTSIDWVIPAPDCRHNMETRYLTYTTLFIPTVLYTILRVRTYILAGADGRIIG